MATSSGLYNDRVKNIMKDRSSTDDRAQDYKETVEIKQAKNKLDKLDETTRVFQDTLIKSTLKSEDYLKHIAKHTKIMARDNFTSQILRLVKYGFYIYQGLKFFKPNLIPDAIKRFETFMKRSGFGAKGMQQNCCCDSRGVSSRMNRRTRRMDRRDGSTRTQSQSSNTTYEANKRASERMDRAKQASMDRIERVRRTAEDIKQRKVTQLQAKYTQDAINKTMGKWNHNAKKGITGIFDKTSIGLKTSSKILGKAATANSASLTKLGLKAIGGVAGAVAGIFTSLLATASPFLKGGAAGLARGGATLAGRAAATGAGAAGGLAARAGITPAMLKYGRLAGRASLVGAAAYETYNMVTMDPAKELRTSRKDVGLGDRYIASLGSMFSFLDSAFEDTAHLGDAGTARTFGQFLEDIDHGAGSLVDWMYKKAGIKTTRKGGDRGLFAGTVNEVGNMFSSGYLGIKRFFSPVTDELKSQTNVLSNLDSNFKEMTLDYKEARKIEYDRSQGIVPGQSATDGLGRAGFEASPVFPRSQGYDSSKQPDGLGGSTVPGSGGQPSVDDRARRSLFSSELSLTPGTSKGSQGWSSHEESKYSVPTPTGLTGSAGHYSKLMSTKTVTPTLNSASSSALQDTKGRVISTANTGMAPHQRAFLDTLAMGDATSGGNSWESPDYNTIVGGSKFEDFSKHPNVVGYRGPKGSSTAAGRYQFLKSTWDDTVKRFNAANPNDPIKDFSPANQDRAAWFLAQGDYSRRTGGRSLDEDLKSGNTEYLKTGLGGSGKNTTWEILQRKSSSDISSAYDSNLRRNESYSGVGSTAFALMKPEQIGLSTALPEVYGSSSQIAIDMNNTGKRNQDIDPGLRGIIQYAGGKAGISRISVISGGQDPASKKGARRVGTSTNHDHGHAADFDMYVRNPDGSERRLRYSNLEDRKIIETFTEHAAMAGGTNFGIGPGYMEDGRMHLGNTGADGRVWGRTMEKGSAEPGISAAVSRGRSQRAGFDLATALNGPSGTGPIPVEIASISPKTHEENVARYSASSGLGSIFGINKAAAEESGVISQSTKGDRLGSGLYQNSATGAFIKDRIDQAHQATNAHIASERIRPNVNPESSIINASQGITIPPSVDLAQTVPTVNTQAPENTTGGSMTSVSNIPHIVNPELMYPLLYHHLDN